MKYIIECLNCGTENTRSYLPEQILCSGCGEGSYVEIWRESGASPK